MRHQLSLAVVAGASLSIIALGVAMEAKAADSTQAQTAPAAVASDAQTLTTPKAPSPAASSAPPMLQPSVIQPVAGDGNALVYIFRPNGFTFYGRTASFYIDDTKIANLRPNGCTVITIPPGIHTLSQRWKTIPILDIGSPLNDPNKIIELKVKFLERNSYYYRLHIDPPVAGGGRILFSWRLDGDVEAVGKQWMGTCHYTAAANGAQIPTEYQSRGTVAPASGTPSTSGAASAP